MSLRPGLVAEPLIGEPPCGPDLRVLRVGLHRLVEVGGGFLHFIQREVTDRAAEQRFGALRRQAVGRGKIVDGQLMLLFALMQQAAVVQRLGVVRIEPDGAIELGKRLVVLPDCSSAWPRVAWLLASPAPVSAAAVLALTSLSDEGDHDPRSKEQPPSMIASSAIGAVARAPKRGASEKGMGSGAAINARRP